jgi:hypothetical protein
LKGSSGPDILLSYHDNDHYNSIRVSSATKPPPPIKEYVSSHRALPIDENIEGAESIDDDGNNMTVEETTNTITSMEPPYATKDVDMNELVSLIPMNTATLEDKNTKDTVKLHLIESQSAKDGNFLSSEEMDVDTTTQRHNANNDATPSVMKDDPAMDGTFRVLQI